MLRKGSIFARALRRAALALMRLSTEHGRVVTHLGNLGFTYPYCSKTLSLSAGRDRHITLRPSCHARHIRELKGFVSAHLKKKQRRSTPTGTPPADTLPSSKRPGSDFLDEDKDVPSAKRLRLDEAGTAVRDITQQTQSPIIEPPANAHQMGDIGESINQSTDRRHTPKPAAVKPFPISTAGAPISSKKWGPTLSRVELRNYLASCGPMGDPDKFAVAELLMTTGLNGSNRTRWLKSNLVSEGMRKLK